MVSKKTIKKNFFIKSLVSLYKTYKEQAQQHKLDVHFKNDFENFISLSKNKNLSLIAKWEDTWPINEQTGTTDFDRHYVYHTAWAARCLAKLNPEKHIDISSSLYFSGICSAFTTIEFYDYRPAELLLTNLSCRSADLTQLHFPDNSIKSLSCMHTVEHVGLGRYGDALNPEGDIQAMKELKRVLAKNGNLFFVVPLASTPKIVFNAHRIYSHQQILTYFQDLKLVEFSLIPDDPSEGGIVTSPPETLLKKQRYGCGCYWFEK